MKRSRDEPIPIGELTEEVIEDLLDHGDKNHCQWEQEQVGYEEKAYLVWVCHTHNIEGGRVRQWERRTDG